MTAPEDSPARPVLSVFACPHCGSSTAHPFSSMGGVCLRCAGDRAFGPERTRPDAPAARTTASAGPAGLPDWIGSYEIIEELGLGGMARVYAARQDGLGRIVALKVLPVGGGRAAELELRFLREAQTVARLRHANIIAIHDSGRADGCVFFSMDYVEDGDLARRLRTQPFAPAEAARMVMKVAAALAHAHAEGVLHRDIKPSNILLDGGEPRLADFGLAAQLEVGGDLTLGTGVLGTPHYLAPEALRRGSAALGVASDLYALGVVLFELLTGRTPFAGASPAEVTRLVETTEAPSPRLLAPAVPRDLATICLKCLERHPARRYAGAGALADDLRRFLAGEPIVARPVSGLGRFARWCRRRPALAAVWLLVSALALGASGAAGWIQRERTRAEAALARARTAEAAGREHLRSARLAQARAVRQTHSVGRRAEALAALVEAAEIRSDAAVRTEAATALQLTDVHPLATWDLQLPAPGEIIFSPDGLVAAYEPLDATGRVREPAILRRWGEAAPLVELARLPAPPAGPLRFSRDGTRLMLRYRDETLRVWRTGEAQPFLTISGRPLPGGAQLAQDLDDDYDFSPDGRTLVLGLPGKGVALHQVADGAEIARWEDGVCFTTVRFSPDGRFVAAAGSSVLSESKRVWLLPVPALTPARVLELPAVSSALAWSGDSRVLAVGLSDNTVAAFDARSGRLLQKHPAGELDLVSVAFAAGDALLVSRGSGPRVHVASFALGQPEIDIDEATPGPLDMPSVTDTFVTASLQGIATRWQIERPAGLRVLPAPRVDGYHFTTTECGLDFSPDGRWAAAALGRYTPIRDTTTGRLVLELDAGDAAGGDLASVAFGPGGDNLLRCSQSAGVQRFRLSVGDDATLVAGPPETLDAEAGFALTDHTADGRRLVLVNLSTGEIKVADVEATGLRTVARWKTPGVYMGALSPDGASVVVTGDGAGPAAAAQRLRVYRAADGKLLTELPGGAFGEAAWSRDGRLVLTSNDQKLSTLWDAATWRPVTRLEGELGGNITTFGLSGDGELAAIVRDGRMHYVSTRGGAELAAFDVPAASGLAVSLRFLPDGKRVGILWQDGRVDVFDPGELRGELARLGLAW